MFTALDAETTGVDPYNSRITQIGLCGPYVKFSILINPLVPVPRTIVEKCGLTNAMLSKAPTFASVAPWLSMVIANICRNSYLAAYNRNFDVSMLNAEFLRHGYRLVIDPLRVLDALPFARKYHPDVSHTLTNMCKIYGINTGDMHDALNDAEALKLLIHKMQRIKRIPNDIEQALVELLPKEDNPDLFGLRE